MRGIVLAANIPPLTFPLSFSTFWHRRPASMCREKSLGPPSAKIFLPPRSRVDAQGRRRRTVDVEPTRRTIFRWSCRLAAERCSFVRDLFAPPPLLSKWIITGTPLADVRYFFFFFFWKQSFFLSFFLSFIVIVFLVIYNVLVDISCNIIFFFFWISSRGVFVDLNLSSFDRWRISRLIEL